MVKKNRVILGLFSLIIFSLFYMAHAIPIIKFVYYYTGVSISPNSITIVQGGSGTVDVEAYAWGYNALLKTTFSITNISVSLQASNVPSGVTCTFSPSSGPISTKFKLTINVGDNVAPGTYNITIKAIKSKYTSKPGYLILIVEEKKMDIMQYLIYLIPVVIGVVGAILFFLIKKSKKGPRPVKLVLSANPSTIYGDGRSVSQITVMTVDSKNNPIPVKADLTINLTSEMGTIQSPIIIPAGSYYAVSTYIAPIKFGSEKITASAPGLSRGEIILNIKEKRRYCMWCGAPMALDAKVCSVCGREPPSGVDVKVCPNCGAVIPTVAKFCGECGARQP